jgi:hypothetical protein
MSHVFISYSSRDKTIVDRICETLEAADIPCWMAPRDIVPGADWSSSIIGGITACKVMLLVFSASSNDSPQVLREVERAVGKRVPIIPFRIENIALGESLEYFLSSSHWLEAYTEPLEVHLNYLIGVLHQRFGQVVPARALGGSPQAPGASPQALTSPSDKSATPPRLQPPSPPSLPAAPPLSSRAPPRRRPWGLIAGAGVLVVSLGAGGAYVALFGLPTRTPTVAGPPDARLVIALTHLQGDTDQQQEKLLYRELTRNAAGANTINVDSTITIPANATAQDGLAQGEAQAGAVLQQTGASGVLWGQVLPGQGLRLHWTTGTAAKDPNAAAAQPKAFDTLALPDLTLADLQSVIGLLVQSRIATVRNQYTGKYSADQLQPLIGQVRKLLSAAPRQGSAVRDAEAGAELRFAFAGALAEYGSQAGQQAALEESIDSYNEVLKVWSRDRPADWARVQNGLGLAERDLYRLNSEPDLLTAAVTAHTYALTVLSPESDLLGWAQAQTALGDCYRSISEIKGDDASTNLAIAAYQKVIDTLPQERAPLVWAAAQNGLGAVYINRGERETGVDSYKLAVKALGKALAARSSDLVPMDWASTEGNIGYVLLETAKRTRDSQTLKDAIAAINNALQVLTEQRTPLAWADLKGMLGDALELQGIIDNDVKLLQAAVDAYEDMLQVDTLDRTPSGYVMAQNLLGSALSVLGEHDGQVEHFRRAVDVINRVLKMAKPEQDPLGWAEAKSELGTARRLWGALEGGTSKLDQAEEAYAQALDKLTPQNDPLSWAAAENGAGLNEKLLGERRHDPATLAKAADKLKAAVDFYKQNNDETKLDEAQAAYDAVQTDLQGTKH